jgi:hypothetical protein
MISTVDLLLLVVCSRKLFSESEAERWWADNRARVLGEVGIRVG